ncbi:MAG TPA: TadE/TadG family type IV pilus assembly protein [Caulobacteraceae bacterium]|jgi:Flp pilus assembly protein TadG|nr:TadE/TadG family type IV pilus assembly protein [Caulobacteraceae bacterium]
MRLTKPLEIIRAFLRATRGGTAVTFALAAPVIALIACGAIDLASVNADRTSMQDASDATALAMAKQLSLSTPAGITARATDYANAQLGQIASNDGTTVTTTISPDNTSVTVAIRGHRNSFFGNLLPPGGWTMQVQSTASTMGVLPLCVLTSGTDAASQIQLQGSAQMTAAKCLVQSDTNIADDPTTALNAGLAQASGTASGPITPSPQTGAPTIADPFASMAINPPLLGLCNPLDLVYDLGVNVLLPGTHCGNITIRQGATLELLPGEYYFTGGVLTMQDNSTLTGSNVVLVFNDNASFVFKDNSTIDLTGRQSGSFAGFVIATTRTNTSTFTISSDAARRLEGAIYIPDATLLVTGNGNQVAEQSAWTVVVAKGLQLSGSPNLTINANYSSSSVPVPGGVGTNYSSGQVTLSK